MDDKWLKFEEKVILVTGAASSSKLVMMLVVAMAWVNADGEVLLYDDFNQAGSIDSQKWEIGEGGQPVCEDGYMVNYPGKTWNSKMKFSTPVSVEFSGVYLMDLPGSDSNALSLATSGGWGNEKISWGFYGRRNTKGQKGLNLCPLISNTGGQDYWLYEKNLGLRGISDITKKENAVTLRIDWWPGELARYFFNEKLIAECTINVPSAALSVGVRDETVGFRIGAIRVTKIIQSAEEFIKKKDQDDEVNAIVRMKSHHTRLASVGNISDVRYALFLHFEDGDKVRDSSVYGFELSTKNVMYEEGRFGRAARFDGEESIVSHEQPMVDPFGSYLSFAFQKQTVECWVKPERTGVTETILGAVKGWQLMRERDGRITFCWGGACMTSISELVPDKWAQLAVVINIDAKKATLYVNGKAEGSTTVDFIPTGGKFCIGAGDAGPFKGLIDEVVIWLDALSPEDMAARAKADEALDNPMVEPIFYALPANYRTYVFFNHGNLPQNWLLLALPEYVFRLPGEGPHHGDRVRWAWENGGWTYTWEIAEDEKKRMLVDFKGRIVPCKDRILYELTAMNPGVEAWQTDQMLYADLRCASATMFHDFDAVRTFVRKNEQFMTVLNASGGELQVNESGDSRVGNGPGPLMMRRSVDGNWMLGIVTDNAGYTVGNFASWIYCMHSNPVWERLKAGESKTIYGCIYLIRGGLDNLWERYREDFLIGK